MIDQCFLIDTKGCMEYSKPSICNRGHLRRDPILICRMTSKDYQELLQQFNLMRQDIASIYQQISELEQERTEHQLVCQTLNGLDKERRAFRLVGGVLCEQTVGTVLPEVQANDERIGTVMEKLAKALEDKEREMDAFTKENKIAVKSGQ